MAAIKQLEYHCVTMEGDTRDASRVLSELCGCGIKLAGFSAVAQRDGKVSLDLAAKTGDGLTKKTQMKSR